MSKIKQALEKELRDLIRDAIEDCCNKDHLPRLQNWLDSPQGKETGEDIIFNMCSNQGIAVQTAMSLLDSDLG